MTTDHESYEFNTHVFVVKIWLEEFHHEGKGTWRGYITHVSSGNRKYIDGFLDVISFIIPYLVDMKAKISWMWKVGNLFTRKRRTGQLTFSDPPSNKRDRKSAS